MIIDFHCHVGKDNAGETLSFKKLKKSMDKWGVDKAVVFSFSNSNKNMIKQSLNILRYSKKNSWVIPFLRFNPNIIKESELNNLLNKGFKGIKLHPFAQRFKLDSSKFFWIYKKCEEKKIPVLFHSSAKDKKFSNPGFILNLAEKFPNLNIVIAHFFGYDLKIIKFMNKYKNLYTETSINSGALRRNIVVYKYKFKKMIFASDIPYDSQGVSLLKLKEAKLKKKDLNLIFYKNAEKILNI